MSYKGFCDKVPCLVVDRILSKDNLSERTEKVYRALFNCAERTVDEDFLPYFLTSLNSKYLPPFVSEVITDYGMSVFADINQLKLTVSSSKSELHDRTIGYAEGYTNSLRGVWTLPNYRTHIEYFLYDWINNNPSGDFSIFEVV